MPVKAAALGFDAAEFGNAAEIDQRRRVREPELHGRQDGLAAGQRLRVPRLGALAASSTDPAR
jgi:hypothetical protein